MGGTPHQNTNSSLLRHHPRRRRSVGRRLFPEGSLVEVQTDEEDYTGVFFVATVFLSPPNSKKGGSGDNSRKVLVEYHDLLAQEDGSERLRESVDISFVRPAPPPQEVVNRLRPNDAVDANYKDGWWVGVVTRVVEGGERFVVSFQNPPDELEFGLAELRVHWDWVDGKWVRPPKQCEAGSMSEVGEKVEVSRDAEKPHYSWFRATIRKCLDHGCLWVEYCTLKDTDGQLIGEKVAPIDIRPCPPDRMDNTFVLHDKVGAYYEFGWWTGVITEVLEWCKYIVYFKQKKSEKEFHASELRPHMEWEGGKWYNASKDSTLAESAESSAKRKRRPPKSAESSVKRKQGRPPKKLKESHQTPEALNNGNNVLENAKNGVATDGLSTYESDSPRIAKDGAKGTEASLPIEENAGFSEHIDKLADHQPDPLIEGTSAERTSAKSNDETQVKESVMLQPRRSSKRGSKPIKGQNSVPRVEDFLDPSRNETVEVIVLDAEEDITELPCNKFSDEPLAKWIEGMQSPSVVNFSGHSMVTSQKDGKNAPVLEENNGNEPETGEQINNLIDEISADLNYKQSLPFVKNNFLWKTLETMDVFKRIPQKPHFRLLEQCKESSREGLAIGYMVNFTSVAEKVSRLQFGDPKSVTDDIMDTLTELETYGFDVGVIRERVVGLLAVRDKQGKLKDEVNYLDSQIAVHKNKKCMFEKEISEKNEEIRNLQKKISLAQSAMEKEDGEIRALQAKLQETQESIQNVEHEFRGIASSEWL